MTNKIDLSDLTKQHLMELAWVLKGTPQVQTVYRELEIRPGKVTLKPDDPNWDEKCRNALINALGHNCT